MPFLQHENYRVVNSAYELRIHACIGLIQFSEFSRPVRIQVNTDPVGSARKTVRTPSERGLGLFLGTSPGCKNGRFTRHGAHENPSFRDRKGCSGSRDRVLHPPCTYKFTYTICVPYSGGGAGSGRSHGRSRGAPHTGQIAWRHSAVDQRSAVRRWMC